MSSLALVLAGSLVASANEIRIGLFVGNDEGLPNDPPLVFAESDAAKMRDLFLEYGDIKPGDATLLTGATARAVENALASAASRIGAIEADGHDAVFVFYYSGHGDDIGLHLGTTRLSHEDLRTQLERTAATVRIAMVDACQSGGLLRKKGGVRTGVFTLPETRAESAHGTAIITSSAASELSQESREIGGGFFTHFLHTALSGAADADENGVVTLHEAYTYVHAETSFRTQSAPETQTPHWDLDLAGAGDVVLTTLEEASARISFMGDLEGTYSLWDESRKRYVADVDGQANLDVAVRPGTIYVHRRMPGWIEEARYVVRRGETHAVLAEDFVVVSYASSASRGDLDKQVRQSEIPDLSLRFAFGFRNFPSRGWEGEYVVPHAIGGIEAKFLGPRNPTWSFDLLTGGTSSALEVEELEPIDMVMTSTALGGTIGFATRPAAIRAGLGARSSFTGITRTFPDWELTQSRGALGVGFNAWTGLYHGRFVADLALNYQLLVTKWDDNSGWPSYADLLLSVGYRF
jgi:hypothetical protein